MPKHTFGTGKLSPLHFITCILQSMKLSQTYKGYASSERFNLDGKVFSKIVIADSEGSSFVKDILVIKSYAETFTSFYGS